MLLYIAYMDPMGNGIWMRFIYNPYANHGAGIFTYMTGRHFGGKCRDSYSSTMVRIWEYLDYIDDIVV